MVRVMILLVFLFLIWVLYASGFEKARKIRISVIAVFICALAFWFDGYDKRNIRNLVKAEDIIICGVAAEYSYRTNFDLSVCVENKADKGTITRLDLRFIASQCEAQQCVETQAVERSLLVEIAPQAKTQLAQNLSFEKLSPTAANIGWSVEVLETKAHR